VLYIHLLSLLGLDTTRAAGIVLLLGTKVLFLIKAAGAVVNLIAL
jgi:hypothetical protein